MVIAYEMFVVISGLLLAVRREVEGLDCVFL
jgi:hypothetical protein